MTREEMLDRLILVTWITTYLKNERYSLTDECNASSYNRRASVIF